MTANAEAYRLSQMNQDGHEGKENIHVVAGALLLACDLIDTLIDGQSLSAQELEFVGHARELAEGARQ